MSLIYFVKQNYEKIPTDFLKLTGALYYHIPAKKRYGKDFQQTLELLKRTEYLPYGEIEEYVNERFCYIVKYAAAHVPYYQKRYAEYGVNIESVHDIRDIVKLPTIDREEVRTNRDLFLSDEYDPGNLMYITTSGSTGNPVGFYQKKSMIMTEWAYTMHIWSRAGYKPNSSRLVLRGKKFRQSGKNPHIFYDPLRKELSCDVFDMTENNLENYCMAIEKYRPEFIHGYMSAVLMLAKYIESRDGGLHHQFKGILATSETILPVQKDYVEKIFNARVFSFYGHSERLVIAGECEQSSAYHVEPLYGYCELLDMEGLPANEGEITGTGFLNEAMPLIRYRTGDVSAWEEGPPCPCGRAHLRLNGVSGRWHQDMLITDEGAYVSLTALNIHSDEFDHIVRYKLIQEQAGIVTMYVMPKKEYVNTDGERIRKILEEKVNGKIRFDVQIVEDLPVKENGKYRIIEQKMQTKKY